MKRKQIIRTLEHMAPKPPRFRRGGPVWHLTHNRPTGELLSLKVLDEVLDELWNTPQERIIVTGIDERGLPIVRRGTDHDTTQ